ncbi:MAG: glycosyltransferase involved in cell wall biosynthesis [Candidatus Nanohaloarchaea archaeon]|jgi:glycosyltransferase involved in cell wall biosynthesis
MLNYEFPPLGGGAANANRYMLKKMADKDVEIDLVTSSLEEEEKESFSENITVHRVDVNKKDIHYWRQREILLYMVRGFRRSKELIEEKDYDLIHAWFGFPCGFMSQHLELPYIVSLRGSDVPGYNNRFSFHYVLLKPVIRSVWRNAEAIVANSSGLRDLARETMDINIDIIPNGVDVSQFAPRASEKTRFRVLTVARLIERKRVGDIIEAVKGLDVELVIVGEGNKKSKLKAMVSKQGLDDKIDFKGYVEHDKLPKIYESADLFVLPSLNEGMSNTLLEAMAAGLPIVTTDTGGTEELIDGNGKIVEKENSSEIRSAIRNYIDDPVMHEKHQSRSREIAKRMSWENKAEDYMELYRKCIQ